MIPHSMDIMDSTMSQFFQQYGGEGAAVGEMIWQGSRDASCNGRMESSHFGKCPGGWSKIVTCTRHSVALILKECA